MRVPIDRPRENARQIIHAATPQAIWLSNNIFFEELFHDIKRHPLFVHPALQELSTGRFAREDLRDVHLDFWYGGVQVFTDALLMAQFHTRSLEARFGTRAKMASRFLLTLNILDEFGFAPGPGDQEPYRGNPMLSHPLLFEAVLEELGATPQVRSAFSPSPEAQALRSYFDRSFSNFWDLLVMLAVTEEEAMVFSPPMRHAAKQAGVGVDDGYYMVHGTSEDTDLNAFDDQHQYDVRCIMEHAVEPAQYDSIRQKSMQCCDIWNDFWSAQSRRLSKRVLSRSKDAGGAQTP